MTVNKNYNNLIIKTGHCKDRWPKARTKKLKSSQREGPRGRAVSGWEDELTSRKWFWIIILLTSGGRAGRLPLRGLPSAKSPAILSITIIIAMRRCLANNHNNNAVSGETGSCPSCWAVSGVERWGSHEATNDYLWLTTYHASIRYRTSRSIIASKARTPTQARTSTACRILP